MELNYFNNKNILLVFPIKYLNFREQKDENNIYDRSYFNEADVSLERSVGIIMHIPAYDGLLFQLFSIIKK